MHERDIAKWRGLKSLVHDAIDATTELVEVGHDSTMRSVTRITDRIETIRGPVRFVDGVRRLSTRGVVWTIRGVNRAVEVVSDAALDVANATDAQGPDRKPTGSDPVQSGATESGTRAVDAALGVVNAAIGDHLSERRNGLDLSMEFRLQDRYVRLDRDSLQRACPNLAPKVALFVHGLGTTDLSWGIEADPGPGQAGECFGSRLERELAFTPVYLRYNTGRAVAENGRALAVKLERFVHAYPVPIDDLTLIGHSMGGLVLRSAAHYGTEAGHVWPSRVRRMFYLGTPHRGAPLSRWTDAFSGALSSIDLPATKIGAQILGVRSAGIRDLRKGTVTHDETRRRDIDLTGETTLLRNARHYFISATVTRDPDHPVGRALGDLLVRATSAQAPAWTHSMPAVQTIHCGGILHNQLLTHATVYDRLRFACAEPETPFPSL